MPSRKAGREPDGPASGCPCVAMDQIIWSAARTQCREMDRKGADKAYDVYYSIEESGAIRYVGITTDYLRRRADQLRNRIPVDRIRGLAGLSRAAARSVEQFLIEKAREMYGLAEKGGSLLN